MADKKITELPFITDVTASVGTAPANTTVIPVVLYGTTNQITADNLKDNFIREVRATVAGVQTYTSSLKGAVTVRGNGIEVAGNLEIGGNVSVKGTLHTQYETSSIIYSSGSTKFGNSFDDLHEFTGSIYFTGSHNINGEDYTYYSSSNSAVFTDFSSSNSNAITSFSSSNSTLFTNFSSSNSTLFTNFSSSNSTLFTNFSSSNSSYNTTFSSSNATYITALSSSNSTYNTTFSSSNATYVTALSSSNSSYNTNLSSSNSTLFTNFSSSNSSYNTNLSSSNSTLFTNFSSSNSTLFTNFSSSNSSYNTTFSSSNSTTFTNYSSSNSSYNTTFSSSNSTTFTNYSSSTANSIAGLSSGVSSELARVYQTTSSLNIFTGSQDSRNFVISQFTSSTNNSIVGVSAFTSSQLDVNLGNAIFTSSARIELNSIEAYTASLKNAAIVSSSTQVQNYDVFALNTNLYTSTGSLIGITNGLMALTASMKAQAIVSSSQQITNYYKFAETASANTFYGNQKVKGNLDIDNKVSITGSLIVSSSSNQLWATPEFQLYNGLGTVNFALTPNVGNQFTIQAYGTKAEILQANEPLRLLSPTLQFVKYDNTPTKVEVTGSLDVNGNQKVNGNLDINNKVSVSGSLIVSSSVNQLWATPEFQLYNGLGNVNFRLTPNTGNQFQIQAYGTKAEITQPNEPLRLLSPELQFVKYDNNPTLVSITGSVDVKTGGITGSLLSTNGVVSGSSQILELTQIAGIEAYTASLKGAIVVDGTNVEVLGTLTAQEIHTTYVTSSILFQSGSTKFGNSSDDTHEFTGSKFEVYNSNASGTMYAVVKNNRARNAAIKTTTTNGSFIAGTSIGTDSFQYQIYDDVEGVNRVTINSQGGTTLQGAVSASQTLRVTGTTQIGTSTTDTSLGSSTKLKVVGDGNVNAGASQGSMFVTAGVTGGDTGLPVNMGTAGASMMLLASINTSTGTATNAAQYLLHFYFDGNNLPNVMYITGSSNFATFSVTSNNTLAISGSASGNKSYAWWINKFGA